jgi:hypothetical protein
MRPPSRQRTTLEATGVEFIDDNGGRGEKAIRGKDFGTKTAQLERQRCTALALLATT